MAELLDLDAYFTRIRWQGGTAPTYATLAGLLAHHLRHVPFENFDVLLGRGIRLDLPALQAKLVTARRGGYCFEHASLFAAVLETLGFAPLRHAARVITYRPPDEAPRTHMFLSVIVDDVRYIVDPGFGPFASPLPLPLDGSGVPPERPTHRVAREGTRWVLHTTRDGADIPAWICNLDVENPIDFEVANHYTATHPASQFKNAIFASAATEDGRVSIVNRDVTHRSGAHVRKFTLADRGALRALLARYFGFDLAEIETMRVPGIPGWS
ncbi:MAG: arylamine N-acetyltransferase family protein [Acetobacteraceae bacterium]